MIPASAPIVVRGTGSYAPEKVLTNGDLSRLVDTSDEWILTRTGIRERRIAADHEAASDLAVRAGAAALAAANLPPDKVDLVIVATITPDMPFPSTACLVQHKLGIPRAVCFDVEAACSGFIYVLDLAANLIRAGRFHTALVIGTEKLSSILDWTDRTTCVLFGDGAGAVVLGAGSPAEAGFGILGSHLGSDGAQADLLHMPGGGSRLPATPESLGDRMHFLKMKGREVFKIAVRVMEQSALDLLAAHNLEPHQVDCVIPHQANLRIIELLASRLDLPLEKFFINLDRYGNTSAASIPLALDEAVRGGRVRPGDLVLMPAFGAGLTWGASLIRWS
ncbi:MAG: ketoacyl-ACP synthase III [Puniceicoccaceae bacterium]|nr:MAG: ketoacyl-ACP synthase III [Puniceicoccaceae bacterium]